MQKDIHGDMRKDIHDDICGDMHKGAYKDGLKSVFAAFPADGRRRRLAAVALIIAVAALTAAVCSLVLFFHREKVSEEKMEDLREEVRGENSGEAGEREEQGNGVSGAESTEGAPENPYAELFARNPDMAAWLSVEGTVIDYPVMQTMEDEEYYLKRDFEGNYDEAGCLILDTDSSMDEEGTTNLIIHGHNMKTGTMFGTLDEYREEEYYREHKFMELYTETEVRSHEVIAVFYSKVYYPEDNVFKYYKFFRAESEEEFSYFYDNIMEMSLYDTGVEASFGDSFLTLSTCTYHVEDGRFVVVAKETGRRSFSKSEISSP